MPSGGAVPVSVLREPPVASGPVVSARPRRSLFAGLKLDAAFKSHGDGWRFTPGPEWQHGKLKLQGVGTMHARGQPRQGRAVPSSPAN
jgi:hypothetical protein